MFIIYILHKTTVISRINHLYLTIRYNYFCANDCIF